MDRKTALARVAYVVDTAGSGRPYWGHDDSHGTSFDSAVLVGWSDEVDTAIVAVVDYLGGAPDVGHACDLALDYLQEIGRLADGCRKADYVSPPDT